MARPRLYDKTLLIRVTREQATAITTYAGVMGVPEAEVIRSALNLFFAPKKKGKAA